MQTRKNPRLAGYDYSRHGIYFVTICTADRQSLLGTIRPAVGGDAHIVPPSPGTSVSVGGDARIAPPSPGTSVSVGGDAHIAPPSPGTSVSVGGDAYIAPSLTDSTAAVDLTPLGRVVEKYLRSMPGVEKYVVMPDHVHILVRIADGPMRASAPTASLPQLIRSLKGLCTKAAGHPIWQRGYYDHIIRDENDFLRCWKYLDENPVSWQERHPAEDPEPENRQGGQP